MSQPRLETVRIRASAVELARWGRGDRTVVLLHDGLGSIAQFREFPGLLAAATSSEVLVYNRPGHGASLPTPRGPWPADWLHQQTDLLAELLAKCEVETPILVGHSDGGSIALLCAADSATAVRGVVALAAHTYVEQVCVDAIEAMRTQRERVITALGRFHGRPAEVFDAWSGVWIGQDFREWDVRRHLGAVTAPTLVVQGANDEYATEDMLANTVAAIGDEAQPVLIEGGGHLLPQERPSEIAELIGQFVASL